MLVALLVDQPQATGAALRDHMLDHVTDPRLRPIAEAVLEGVRSGEMPTRADLLARVEPHVALELRDEIFAGRFEKVDDPTSVLAESVRLMEVGALDVQIHALDQAIVTAKAAGDHAAVLSATQAKLELRRRQADIQTVGRPPATPSR
jgi:hypothetical protein